MLEVRDYSKQELADALYAKNIKPASRLKRYFRRRCLFGPSLQGLRAEPEAAAGRGRITFGPRPLPPWKNG